MRKKAPINLEKIAHGNTPNPLFSKGLWYRNYKKVEGEKRKEGA